MTEQQKQQIKLMREHGYRYVEIAEIMELSENTIKSYGRRNYLEAGERSPLSFCKQCHKPIAQKPKTKTRIFCSTRCKQTWWNRQR